MKIDAAVQCHWLLLSAALTQLVSLHRAYPLGEGRSLLEDSQALSQVSFRLLATPENARIRFLRRTGGGPAYNGGPLTLSCT